MGDDDPSSSYNTINENMVATAPISDMNALRAGRVVSEDSPLTNMSVINRFNVWEKLLSFLTNTEAYTFFMVG